MNGQRIKTKLKLFFKIFVISPKNWNSLKKTDILIYDLTGSEFLMPYLKKYSVSKMAIRGESINLFCLLNSMLKLSFWKNPLLAYTHSYIKAVLPKVIITFNDNNTRFYSISKQLLKCKTILIQNGSRDNWLDDFDRKYKFHVDYMLVHGVNVGNYYSASISGEVLAVGSLKNNLIPILNETMDDGVLFISQWTSPPFDKQPFCKDYDFNSVSWGEYFSAELIVLKFLDKWCFENNKKLKVCGREKDAIDSEESFYKDHLFHCEWLYIPRKDNYNSYKLVDNSELVVHIDSTLGYESIARGKKTATFSCRGSTLLRDSDVVSWPFGWTGDLPNNGPFWTNNQDIEEFQRVMDYINTMSYKSWEKSLGPYSNGLMEFDSGNTHLVSLLEKLLPTT